MKNIGDALTRIFNTISEKNPSAILTGNVSLYLQNFKVRNETLELEVIIPEYNKEFIKANDARLCTVNNFSGDVRYNCKTYIYYEFVNYFNLQDSEKELFYVKILTPIGNQDVFPEWIECMGLKCATFDWILHGKIRKALDKNDPEKNKHAADLMYFLTWNTDYQWNSFRNLINDLFKPIDNSIFNGSFFSFVIGIYKPLVFFCVKATGLDPVNDRIFEFAAIKITTDKRKVVFFQRINPTILIPQDVPHNQVNFEKEIHHTPTFREVASSICNFFKDCDIAGFNILSFDIPILIEEIIRAGEAIPFNNDTKYLDVFKIFQSREKSDLSSAYHYYCGKMLDGVRDSEDDAYAAIEILNEQILKYGLPCSVDELHEIFNEGCNMVDFGRKFKEEKDGDIVFTFGSHKNESVFDNFDYLKWMLIQDFPYHTKCIIEEILNGDIRRKEKNFEAEDME